MSEGQFFKREVNMHNFKTLQLAKELYIMSKKVRVRAYVKDQLCRAALSVCLNLSEGSQRKSIKDRLRFYNYALSSLREVQTVIWIENLNYLNAKSDHLGASIFKLITFNQKL